MKKYLIIAVIILILGAGAWLLNERYGSGKPAESKVVNVTITAKKNEWRWDTQNIKVNEGDTINFTFINEDEYDHGFGIDGYGVNEPLRPSSTVTKTVTATRKGTFNFYCSIPCGNGEVDGQDRGHFDMRGTLEVV